jgi:hypothetical protein
MMPRSLLGMSRFSHYHQNSSAISFKFTYTLLYAMRGTSTADLNAMRYRKRVSGIQPISNLKKINKPRLDGLW